MNGDDKMTTLTGREFNEKYQDKKFVKLTNESEKHNGYQFRTGLNVDTLAFNPSGECEPGGIYFCELDKLWMWMDYSDYLMYYARLVSIPDDARVYEEEDKWKADRMILGERRKIEEVEIWSDEKFCLEAVKQYWELLKYVRNQTEVVCLEAVRQNACALQYVSNQTEKLCLSAVRQNGSVLEYVRNQTEAICMAAVKQDGSALEYVRDQTEEICREALRQNCHAFKYVKNRVEKKKEK